MDPDRRVEPRDVGPAPIGTHLLAAMVHAEQRRPVRRIDLGVAEYLRVDFLHTGG